MADPGVLPPALVLQVAARTLRVGRPVEGTHLTPSTRGEPGDGRADVLMTGEKFHGDVRVADPMRLTMSLGELSYQGASRIEPTPAFMARLGDRHIGRGGSEEGRTAGCDRAHPSGIGDIRSGSGGSPIRTV
ncbi:hypothetical protein ABT187_36810 [Streptomyces sp. NPDC001817]|uniref:hypothetical protein n=1 Tax=Streptomyces sp. NPDC001817 TaxID=3154398 RepID=UPI00331CA76B